jgi:DNA-binding protein H-NS
MSTYRIVKAQIAKLEKQAADFLKKESADVIAKIKALIAEYGLTAADLGLTGKAAKAGKAAKGTGKKSATAKPAGVPLYADPASGKTWTGKGKPPNWIVEGLKKGQSKDDFLIAKAAPAAVPAPAKKAGKVVKVAKVAKVVKVVKAAAKKPAKTLAKKVVKAPTASKPVKKTPARNFSTKKATVAPTEAK